MFRERGAAYRNRNMSESAHRTTFCCTEDEVVYTATAPSYRSNASSRLHVAAIRHPIQPDQPSSSLLRSINQSINQSIHHLNSPKPTRTSCAACIACIAPCKCWLEKPPRAFGLEVIDHVIWFRSLSSVMCARWPSRSPEWMMTKFEVRGPFSCQDMADFRSQL